MQPVSADARIEAPEVDIARVARLLVRWHGPYAARRARLRAQELKKCDDMSGYALWLDIEGAIDRRRPAAGPTALSQAA